MCSSPVVREVRASTRRPRSAGKVRVAGVPATKRARSSIAMRRSTSPTMRDSSAAVAWKLERALKNSNGRSTVSAARRRRLHWRLHRLSAAARGGARDRRGRRLRTIGVALRSDERVTVVERRNFRYADVVALGAPFDFACADVSFISLAKLAANFAAALGLGGRAVFLIKPQFEAGRGAVGSRGVCASGRTSSCRRKRRWHRSPPSVSRRGC